VYALVKLCQQHVQQQKARRYVQVAYNLQCTSTVNNVHEYASIYSQCSMSDRRRRSLSDAVRGFHLASLLRCLSASAAWICSSVCNCICICIFIANSFPCVCVEFWTSVIDSNSMENLTLRQTIRIVVGPRQLDIKHACWQQAKCRYYKSENKNADLLAVVYFLEACNNGKFYGFTQLQLPTVRIVNTLLRNWVIKYFKKIYKNKCIACFRWHTQKSQL